LVALEEFAFATLEELAFALLLEEVPCNALEDVPGKTLADERGSTFAEEMPGRTLAEEFCTGLGTTAAEEAGSVPPGCVWVPVWLGSMLLGEFAVSSEQFMNARTDPRTRTDFRNWCFIFIL